MPSHGGLRVVDHGRVLRRHEMDVLSNIEMDVRPAFAVQSSAGSEAIRRTKRPHGIAGKFRTSTARRDASARTDHGLFCTPISAGRSRTAPLSQRLRAAQAEGGRGGDIGRLVSGGFHSCRRSPARRQGSKRRLRNPTLHRSQGGLTTKICLAAMRRTFSPLRCQGREQNRLLAVTAMVETLGVSRVHASGPEVRITSA